MISSANAMSSNSLFRLSGGRYDISFAVSIGMTTLGDGSSGGDV